MKLTATDRLLMATDALLRHKTVTRMEYTLLNRNLRDFHPETDAQMALGLILEAFLRSLGAGSFRLQIREAYINVMVEQGHDRADIVSHLNEFSPDSCMEPFLMPETI